QLQIQELRKRLTNQRLLTSSLKADLDAKPSQRGRKREAPVDPALSSNYKRILLLAKKWTIFHEPWINSDAFMRYPSSDAPAPYSTARFANETKYHAGYITELHNYLEDQELQELAARLPAFRSEFTKQISNERSSSLDRIRTHAQYILRELSLPACIGVAQSGPDRATNEILMSLLRQPTNPTSKFAPIFYPRDLNMVDDYLFLNEFQPRVSYLCFF
ncbi:hypothetical protein K435DRAFT_697160, partial [Dendrothele bispora CBS 962.96]